VQNLMRPKRGHAFTITTLREDGTAAAVERVLP